MIKLKQKQDILIMFFRDGKSQRAIARETGVSRKTISKYIKEYEVQKNQLLGADPGSDIGELTDSIVAAPKYDSSNRKKRKVTAKVVTAIQTHLDANEKKRQNGQSKIQKKKIDIYEALVAEGFDISYSTVCNTIRKMQNQAAEAFIKARYELGDVCEFDWGEAKLRVAGKMTKIQLSVFTGAAGNYRHAEAFLKQDTPCFLESHAEFHEHLGNVYKLMVYDNTRVAVKRLAGAEGEPTDALLQLSLYYGFKFRFCNPNSGNEKPHVERSVEYVRRKAFSSKDEFDSLEEINEHLRNICAELNAKPQKGLDGKTALDILEAERPYLLPGLPKYDAARITELRVNKYSVVMVDGCYYSVPDKHVGQMVLTKVYSNEIRCFYEGAPIAAHARKMGSNLWTIDLNHYLSTLKKKPGALASSVALHQADPRLQKIYRQHYITKERDFIDLIFFISEHGLEKVEEAISLLTKVSPLEVTTETIKAICGRNPIKKAGASVRSDTTMQIEAHSLDMLKLFGQLIPGDRKTFAKEVAVL
ncbi:MAG: IS21 family transposase [Bacillota bacterium]|nr:IS21 family transposase [Bacillota bacterium]